MPTRSKLEILVSDFAQLMKQRIKKDDPRFMALMDAIRKESYYGGYSEEDRGLILEKMFTILERKD